jgi:hypothetical protein
LPILQHHEIKRQPCPFRTTSFCTITHRRHSAGVFPIIWR